LGAGARNVCWWSRSPTMNTTVCTLQMLTKCLQSKSISHINASSIVQYDRRKLRKLSMPNTITRTYQTFRLHLIH
jgi:hypothetical protein